jgi:hypothetical protein
LRLWVSAGWQCSSGAPSLQVEAEDLSRIAVVVEPAWSIFDGLWQGGETRERSKGSLRRQGNQGCSAVISGWPRYMRVHRFEEAGSVHRSSYQQNGIRNSERFYMRFIPVCSYVRILIVVTVC